MIYCTCNKELAPAGAYKGKVKKNEKQSSNENGAGTM